MAMELDSFHCCFLLVTPSFAPFVAIIIICCWACGVEFNKESEKEKERNRLGKKSKNERMKEGRGPYDKSMGLFLDGFLFLFLISFT